MYIENNRTEKPESNSLYVYSYLGNKADSDPDFDSENILYKILYNTIIIKWINCNIDRLGTGKNRKCHLYIHEVNIRQIKGKTQINEWKNITNPDASTQVHCMVQLSNYLGTVYWGIDSLDCNYSWLEICDHCGASAECRDTGMLSSIFLFIVTGRCVWFYNKTRTNKTH